MQRCLTLGVLSFFRRGVCQKFRGCPWTGGSFPTFFYFFNWPLSYAQSRSWMISLRVYFPALEGIRFRMSGRLGSIGRMNPGSLSYIAWTPEMISLASFSSILVPLRAVFILLALIFFLTSPAQSVSGIYRFFKPI